MSQNLQKLLKEALLNNSYDYDAMHRSLKKTWMNSFSYLYTMQKEYIEYEELFYFSNDIESRNHSRIGHMYLDKLIYANFDVDYDLIRVMNREEFRTSKFYGQKFTIEDIKMNPHIFSKIPVVIIDDKVIWDYQIKVSEECTTFTLPFRRNFVLKDERNPDTGEVIYVDHKVQVLVLDNIFYQRISTNKSMINFNATAKQFKVSSAIIEKFIESDVEKYISNKWVEKYKVSDPSLLPTGQEAQMRKEIDKSLKSHSLPIQDGTMMCSIHIPNEYGEGYRLGTEIITLVRDENGDYVAELSDNLNNLLHTTNRNFYMSFIFFNRLYRHTFYTGKNTTTARDGHNPDLLVVQQSELVPYKTPVPVENFMVFKKRKGSGKYILEKNSKMLQLHYPNIYSFKDENIEQGDEYQVFYFYHNAYDLEYTVLFDFYYRYLVDKFSEQTKSLEEVINDIYYGREEYSGFTKKQIKDFEKTFKKILNYTYYKHKYGEMDFLTRYVNIKGNEDKEVIEYKDETLKDWIKVEPHVLREYVLDQKKLGSSYHLFTNTIDLASRLRTDTSVEFGMPSRSFDEERYVFSFANEKDFPTLLDCRVFVDGLMVVDLYQERRLFMDYLYIPASMVTEDSYIEIEIFPTYSFSQGVTFTSMDDEKEITIMEPKDNIYPTTADIYFEDNDLLAHRYDKNFFDITSIYDRGEFLFESDDPEKPVKFTRLNTFKIKPNSENVLNVPLTLNFSKCPNGMEVLIDRDGYPYMEIIEDHFNFNLEYIRIFRNGRLLPRSKYAFFSSYHCPRLLLLDYYEAGELIYIDVTPYRYTEIYHQTDLSPENTLIDLKGIINKPFDIRYYDVYLNGRKLSLNNVFSITPTQLTLVNIKSNYDLTIYERERDWEYFGLDYTQNIYYFSLDDFLNESYISEDERNKIIKDIIDNTKDDRLNIHPNTNEEERLDDGDDKRVYAIFHVFYYDELLPKTYVNPDRLQFSEDLLSSDFPEILEMYKQVRYDEAIDEYWKNITSGMPEVICLDPDIIVAGAEDNDNLLAYMVGHPNEVEQEYLDQTIIIDNDPNIDKEGS